jgi:SnoaL-like protein
LHPLVSLVRRWAVDWLAAGQPAVCEEILTPDYAILIGGYLLDGRDDYVNGTLAQLDRFPGLGLTVHQLVCSDDQIAVRFTEHGASARLDWQPAAWTGIALFRWDGQRLSGCRAEEDYLGRRRQLATRRCDPIEPPAAAPWSTRPAPRDASAEAVVTDWLARGDLSPATLDDGWTGRETSEHLQDAEVEIGELFSAGTDVAFHARQTGRYAGGLNGLEVVGAPGAHHLAGIVQVQDGAVRGGRIIRDRLGLSRALAEGAG